MDAGNVAQWAAVAVALILGIRAELRTKTHSQRDLAKVEAVAFSHLTDFLSLVINTIPANIYDEDHWTPAALKIVLDASRNAIEPIVAAFPNSASYILSASDYLSELIHLRQQFARMDSREVLIALQGLYGQFRLLSIIVAMREKTKSGGTISLEKLHNDKYRVEFENRYRKITELEHKQIDIEFKERLQRSIIEFKQLQEHLASITLTSATREENRYD